MKAAYVFNFVKFVDSPEWASTDVIEICVLGAEDVRAALAAASADKTVGTRRIVVRSIIQPSATERCDVFYVDSSERSRDIAPALSRSALTIGDAGDFTREGGVIRLYMESNRLRFVVNVENARRSGLQVSSNLLKLATRIEQGATP
jgi:hypothetical protein